LLTADVFGFDLSIISFLCDFFPGGDSQLFWPPLPLDALRFRVSFFLCFYSAFFFSKIAFMLWVSRFDLLASGLLDPVWRRQLLLAPAGLYEHVKVQVDPPTF